MSQIIRGCVAATVLRRLIARAHFGAAAREAITEKGFTWENNARRVEVLIRQCANSIGDPSRGLEGQ